MGQILTEFAGTYNAIDYAYGVVGGPPPLVAGAQIASGSVALPVQFGFMILSSGVKVAAPFNTNAPITIGSGANAETVTPSAVSNSTPEVYNSTTVTATYANAHGIGDPISSGTFGLQEALNAASAAGGGVVVLSPKWGKAGGTTAMLDAATIPAGVSVLDNRSGGGGGVGTYTVTIANAQVLTNNSVPTPVLAAPGAGNMWDIIDLVVENKNTGTAYASGGAMALYYGTSSSGVLATATIAATFLTSPTAAQVIKVAGALASTLASSIVNTGLVFTNPTADFTTGTGTVILKVTARLITGL